MKSFKDYINEGKKSIEIDTKLEDIIVDMFASINVDVEIEGAYSEPATHSQPADAGYDYASVLVYSKELGLKEKIQDELSFDIKLDIKKAFKGTNAVEYFKQFEGCNVKNSPDIFDVASIGADEYELDLDNIKIDSKFIKLSYTHSNFESIVDDKWEN